MIQEEDKQKIFSLFFGKGYSFERIEQELGEKYSYEEIRQLVLNHIRDFKPKYIF